MRKRNLFVVGSLVFFSLGCLSMAGSARLDAESSAEIPPTLTNAVPIAAGLDTLSATRPAYADRCAVVIADTALHLREAGNVHAPSKTHLRRGDVVEVIGQEDPLWWYLRIDGFTGYARSMYLEEVECVK